MSQYEPVIGLEIHAQLTRYYSRGGPGVRTDAAIYTPATSFRRMTTPCAPSSSSGRSPGTRPSRACGVRLMDMGVHGVKTTKPFHLEILSTPEFQAATFDTGFIEKHPKLIDYSSCPPPPWWRTTACNRRTQL